MEKNGVYLDNNILRQLAENINKRYNDSRGRIATPYSHSMDIYRLSTPIKAGYYDLHNVPLGGIRNTELDTMLYNWFGRDNASKIFNR